MDFLGAQDTILHCNEKKPFMWSQRRKCELIHHKHKIPNVLCQKKRQENINNRLNMKLDLQSFFGLHVRCCTELIDLDHLPQHLGS